MSKRSPAFFAIWLGVTILAAVVLVFLVLSRCWPDFFRDMTLVL